MKTAYIAPFSMDSLRGTSIRARNMMRALSGISEAHLIAHSALSMQLSRERVHAVGACGLVSFSRRTVRILRTIHPDVIHGCTSASIAPMFLYKLFFSPRVRIIYELHGWAWYEQSRTDRLFARLALCALDYIGLWFSSGVIVVSTTYRTFLSRQTWRAERIVTIWDAAEFDVPYQASVPHEGIIAGYIGGAGWWQGLPFIVGAAKKLQNRSDIKFIIAGFEPADGKLFPRFPNITYPGFVQRANVVEMIRSCDVMLSTRVEETSGNLLFPLKLAEYMATGRSVISSGAGDQVRIIREAGCGEVVTPISADALADSIEAFSQKSREERDVLGYRAYTYAREHLLYSSLKRKLEDFYERFKT